MRIVLNESVPEGVAVYLLEHEVKNLRELGIKGTKNGKLLNFIEAGGYETFITADKRMERERDLSRRQFAILLISTNNWRLIKPHGATIEAAVKELNPGQITKVDCGIFVPKKFRKPGASSAENLGVDSTPICIR